jgi:hypothetical protein
MALNFEATYKQEAIPKNNEADLVKVGENLVLAEGIHRLKPGEKTFIGPLASCYGIVITLENDGAVIAHIPPEAKLFRKYILELQEQFKQIDPQLAKQVFIFSKEKDPFDERELLKELLENIVVGLKKLQKFTYTDGTYVQIDTAINKITSQVLHGDDLSPQAKTTPLTINY